MPHLTGALRAAAPFGAPFGASIRQCRSVVAVHAKANRVGEFGALSLKGTARQQNEDRYTVQVDGDSYSLLGIFDGHGGTAVAEWLKNNIADFVASNWQAGNAAPYAINEAFQQADRSLLAPKKGFFGQFMERGVGGARCGATGAVALLYEFEGASKLLSANVGDSRVLLIRDGSATQLTVDHIPDSDDERNRIESQNPNPKQPLVRYVGGTWRVGGILALSRAFGDAYMKGSLQFEGPNTAGSDGYSAGFGLVAEPDVRVADLSGGGWLVIATDGLFETERRGGGGGLENEQVAAFIASNASKTPQQLAEGLTEKALAAGSTDDISVIVAKLT